MALGSLRGTIRDTDGIPVSGVTVQVNLTGSSSATIYSDRIGTGLGNPFTNQDDGSFEFFADTAARYDLVFSKVSVTFDNSDYVDVGVDMAAAGSVTNYHLATDAVSTSKVQDIAITASKLRSDATVDANRAVTTDHIRDLNVTTAKLADGSVTAPKLDSSLTILSGFGVKGTETRTGVGSHTYLDKTVTHGLGTDDVVVMASAIGSVVAGEVSWIVVLPDGSWYAGLCPTSTSNTVAPLPAIPTTGDVNFRFINAHNASQDITLHYAIVKR